MGQLRNGVPEILIDLGDKDLEHVDADLAKQLLLVLQIEIVETDSLSELVVPGQAAANKRVSQKY